MDGIVQADIPVPSPGEPKLRIDCFGKASVVYAGNLLIGRGVRSVEFRQEAEKPATITLECDIEQLGFSIIEHGESKYCMCSCGKAWHYADAVFCSICGKQLSNQPTTKPLNP